MTDRLNIRSTVAALALAAIVLAVAACGGSSGSSSSAAPPATSTPTSTPASSGGGEVSAAAGKVVFTSNCATCHTLADAGATGSVGPNLDDLKPDEETVKNQVTNGGGGMPAFGGQLSETQIESVAKYVSSVAGKGGSSSGGSGGTP
jgi:mono/diheme cytochrome c family protein